MSTKHVPEARATQPSEFNTDSEHQFIFAEWDRYISDIREYADYNRRLGVSFMKPDATLPPPEPYKTVVMPDFVADSLQRKAAAYDSLVKAFDQIMHYAWSRQVALRQANEQLRLYDGIARRGPQ